MAELHQYSFLKRLKRGESLLAKKQLVCVSQSSLWSLESNIEMMFINIAVGKNLNLFEDGKPTLRWCSNCFFAGCFLGYGRVLTHTRMVGMLIHWVYSAMIFLLKECERCIVRSLSVVD